MTAGLAKPARFSGQEDTADHQQHHDADGGQIHGDLLGDEEVEGGDQDEGDDPGVHGVLSFEVDVWQRIPLTGLQQYDKDDFPEKTGENYSSNLFGGDRKYALYLP